MIAIDGPLKVCGIEFEVRPFGMARHFPPAWVSSMEATWSRWRLGLSLRLWLHQWEDNSARERPVNGGRCPGVVLEIAGGISAG